MKKHWLYEVQQFSDGEVLIISSKFYTQEEAFKKFVEFMRNPDCSYDEDFIDGFKITDIQIQGCLHSKFVQDKDDDYDNYDYWISPTFINSKKAHPVFVLYL
mgnify:CR=1 FL=1